jgi:hypothetical protein
LLLIQADPTIICQNDNSSLSKPVDAVLLGRPESEHKLILEDVGTGSAGAGFVLPM